MRVSETTDLPVGWVKTSVGEVSSDIVSGSGFPKEYQGESAGEYPFAKVGTISKVFRAGHKTMNSADNYISENTRIKIKAKIFPKGTIVFPKIGEALKGNYRVIASREMIFDNNVMGIVPETRCIEGDYFYYFLTTKDFGEFAVATAVPSVRRGDVANISIPLPPINEQKRIVAKIEELISELDKGIESFKTAREQLKVYRQVLLNEAAKGDLSAQRDDSKTRTEKATVSLNDVVLSVGQGWSPRCLEHPSESDVTWGVIKTSAIQPLDFISSANKQLPDQLEPRPHLEIFPGDVLITRAGPRNRVGIACYVKSVRPRLMVCDKVYRIKVKQDKILPEFLVMLLNSPRVLEELETLKTGISDSGLNLTQDRFLSMKVVVPSLETQRAMLEDLEQKLSNIAFFEAQLDSSLEAAETLRQSILKKAFSGQLVPQDPDDEPAAQLLARIKAECDAHTKGDNGKKRTITRKKKTAKV